MEGLLIGVFGSDPKSKAAFENSIAKRSEAEGITVYHRIEGGRRSSFLDDSFFPERIQGYSRIASFSDYAFYMMPGQRLSAPDGELALLIDSQALKGRIIAVDFPSSSQETVQSSFKGLKIADYPMEERSSKSSMIDLGEIRPRSSAPGPGTLIYIDRAFNVKGVGLVVLGFVASGKVSLHDRLRLIPGASGKTAEVRGIQVSDEDHDSAGRGIRVGLSLRNVELKDLEKTTWLDDSSFALSSKLVLDYEQNQYYKQNVIARDLHIQCLGESLVGNLAAGKGKTVTANLAHEVPAWSRMRVSVLDLNGKSLRVAGGASVASF